MSSRAAGGVLHRDLLHRERFTALVRRFAQLTNNTVPRFIELACQQTTYKALLISLNHGARALSNICYKLPDMKSAQGVLCQAHTSVLSTDCVWSCPIIDASFLDRLARLLVLKTVHVCLVDSLPQNASLPSFLSFSASIPLDTAPVCQGDLNVTQYQIRDVSDCGVRHYL